eukprot:CAMPEP_0197439452 /NCGR_PEP_ID=MMETSP1175-20131217/6197_1 /TAXON_ID=1003142 /ORGANISM="Triceratium dubium, Strain CCMP147" /LENGTH=41 /DNA_ID= /DNA_START= /DNA_END= /DNA_ORIENTATION=
MGLADKAEEAMEKKMWDEGAYGALAKYKAVRMWQKMKSCCG